MAKEKCATCGKNAHNFEKEEHMACVAPRDVLKFGQYKIEKEYRDALYEEYPFYNTEEVVGSYLGHNPHFPSEDDWFSAKEEEENEDDE